jgi:hypothetical protein
MKRTREMIELIAKEDRESFRKNLFIEVTKRLEEKIEEIKKKISQGILVSEEGGDEEEALHVDPNMAKEFFLLDIEHKGHTITIKSLGTGIGKPLVSYIDGERFEIFTDKEIAVRESKAAIDRMIEKNIDDIKNLRKNPKKIEQEKKAAKEASESEESTEEK